MGFRSLYFGSLSQMAAPAVEIGPIRINFAPNLAQAAAPQAIQLGAHRLNPPVQCGELVTLGARVAQQDRQAIGFVERRAKLGDPLRSSAPDNFG